MLLTSPLYRRKDFTELCSGAGDRGSIPGLGRSHMLWSNEARAPRLPSLRATANAAHAPQGLGPQPEYICCNCWSPHTQSLCSTRDTTAMRSRTATKNSPLTASRECHAQQRRPSATKNKNKFLKNSDEITWSLSQCSPTVPHHTTMVQMGHTCANTLTPNHSVSRSPFHVTHCPVKPASVCAARCAES